MRALERALFLIGILGVSTYAAAWLHARATQERAERLFDRQAALAEQIDAASPPASEAFPHGTRPGSCPSDFPAPRRRWRALAGTDPHLLPAALPDVSTWSPNRRTAYEEALAADKGAPLARLDIPAIDLSVMVLPGVSALSLNGGVGHVPGTPLPGEAGNVGLAGHRDGFFRGLEHLAVGDAIRLVTPEHVFAYEVEWIRVTEPADVAVLRPGGADTLTLVTCYPFRVVGPAPRRYVVRARCASEDENA